VNEAHASVHDLSGQLQEDGITNDGSFTVGAGASMSLLPLQSVYGNPASFANYGALVNDGSITAEQTTGTVTFTQAGGPIKGNEVVLGGGALLVDKSGAAQNGTQPRPYFVRDRGALYEKRDHRPAGLLADSFGCKRLLPIRDPTKAETLTPPKPRPSE
jgi:hypothetical protein